MSYKLPTFGKRSAPPKDYQALWYALKDKDPEKFDEYGRPYQLQACQDFEKAAAQANDVALCMPTGTGKTVVAHLIGRFRQLHTNQRVLYLTPNHQLVSQVCDEAKDLGIPAVDLRGSWNSIPVAERNDYAAGRAIGVAPYHTIFNSNPKPDTPGLLILDDVHAAGDAAIGRWQVRIRAGTEPELFEGVHGILSKALAPQQLAACGPNPPPEAGRVQLVAHRDWLRVCDEVGDFVKSCLTSDADRFDPEKKVRFPWFVTGGILPRMFCFLQRNTITIRPWVPPSRSISQFKDANTRLYLSATIDRWGHMQQVVGVEQFERVDGLAAPIQGQRLVVDVNRLPADEGWLEQTLQVLERVDKALVLLQDFDQRTALEEALADAGNRHPVFGSEVEEDIVQFSKAKTGYMVLANRYDGMDLGHGACQHIILVGLPTAIGPKETFVSRVLGISSADDGRARQRIQQGMGRCTRDKDDRATVWLVGSDLSTFLSRAEVRRAFPAQLRLELEASDQINDWDQAMHFVGLCGTNSDEWRDYYTGLEEASSDEPEDVQIDAEVQKVQALESRYAWRLSEGLFTDALEIAENIADRLQKAGLTRESGAWYYLASVAADLEEHSRTAVPNSPQGQEFLRRGLERLQAGTWVPFVQRRYEEAGTTEAERAQAEATLAFVKHHDDKLRDVLEALLTNLESREDSRVKQALHVLGESLGFKSYDCSASGSPDGIWADGERAHSIWEAKTEKQGEGFISLDDARQMTAQPKWVTEKHGLDCSRAGPVICLTNVYSIDNNAKQELASLAAVHCDDFERAVAGWTESLGRISARVLKADERQVEALVGLLRTERLTTSDVVQTLGVKPASKILEIV